MKHILLTGGLGYIGSHVALELIRSGSEVVIMDDLSNSEIFILDRLRDLTGKNIIFEQGDIRDATFLENCFKKYEIEGVIHFAAKKAVGESVQKPLLYFDVNVTGLINLLKKVDQSSADKFIFSSSCTVYGNPEHLPVTEDTPFGDTPSPYGKTKQMCEEMLQAYAAVSTCSFVSLRYFNPVGGSPNGQLGELPQGIPNNLVPFLTQAVLGKRGKLRVFGDDYDTPDGSAIRDYIHVTDLARAHVLALKKETGKYNVFNLGTGQGYSVLEVIETFEQVNQIKVPFEIVARREGDLPIIYGDPSKAQEQLGWKAAFGLEEMLKDAWDWEMQMHQNQKKIQ